MQLFSAVGDKIGNQFGARYKSKSELVGGIILIVMGLFIVHEHTGICKWEGYALADSNITKRALASALKELMQNTPFQKISVADICEKCDMNRKSFYYHFKDKYELMNWIFDMDFIGLIEQYADDDSLAGITALARVLYDNRKFYSNAFSVQGQNSLSEHIREIALPILQRRLKKALHGADNPFYFDFFTDALIIVMFRWIEDDHCDPPEKFLPEFLSCTVLSAEYIRKKMHHSNQGDEKQ